MTGVSVSESENTPKVIQNNVYDENGERLLKSEGNNNTYYFYDGGIAYTTDGNNVKTANLYDDSGCVLSVRNKGNDYYNYLSDAQGSTSTIMKDGKTNNLYEYSDFGETNLISNDNAIDNEIGYTGAVLDKTTGLYYMNARYYKPSNSRFISQDTYRGEEDDPMTWNLYSYCANNPINYIAPSGHKYNRNKAAKYAKDWAASFNKDYKSFQGRGGDCTNFVSQCIKAGGFGEKTPKYVSSYERSTKYWYCRYSRWRSGHRSYKYSYKYTTSWINVGDFYYHMQRYRKVGTGLYKGKSGIAKIQKEAREGDVIQLCSRAGNVWCHSMIVYKKNSKNILRCAQHSGSSGPKVCFYKCVKSWKYSKCRIIRPK